MPKNKGKITVIGGGMAGCEAAWQGLRAGYQVRLVEMRPEKGTPAHKTGNLAELVCSNSFKSKLPETAPGQLKYEMRAMDSLILAAGEAAEVPAGQALAVDRLKLSAFVEEKLQSFESFERVNEEWTELPSEYALERNQEVIIIATGPLTSDGLIPALQELSASERNLFFYDAIAPTLDAESIDREFCFEASRYDKGGADYLNLPLDRDQYEAFIDAVIAAEKAPLHEFEKIPYFECCLPIEVMIERGRETLRFGPMKPVGLTDPKTGRWPYACIQLRAENLDKTMYSMVGFQTKMKWPEQRRVFTECIPALHEAEFFRFGSVHRNTYLDSPRCLSPDLSFQKNRRVFLAGQVSGVEGYTESASMGIMAGRFAAARLSGVSPEFPPKETITGALLRYVTFGPQGDFQPMNANLGLLPPLEGHHGRRSKKLRKQLQCQRAREAFDRFNSSSGMINSDSVDAIRPESL